jgi:hypothetical protein
MSTNGDLTVFLVHRAFTDVSGFGGLCDELLGQAVRVFAPPNPATGSIRADPHRPNKSIGEFGPSNICGLESYSSTGGVGREARPVGPKGGGRRCFGRRRGLAGAAGAQGDDRRGEYEDSRSRSRHPFPFTSIRSSGG